MRLRRIKRAGSLQDHIHHLHAVMKMGGAGSYATVWEASYPPACWLITPGVTAASPSGKHVYALLSLVQRQTDAVNARVYRFMNRPQTGICSSPR